MHERKGRLTWVGFLYCRSLPEKQTRSMPTRNPIGGWGEKFIEGGKKRTGEPLPGSARECPITQKYKGLGKYREKGKPRSRAKKERSEGMETPSGSQATGIAKRVCYGRRFRNGRRREFILQKRKRKKEEENESQGIEFKSQDTQGIEESELGSEGLAGKSEHLQEAEMRESKKKKKKEEAHSIIFISVPAKINIFS